MISQTLMEVLLPPIGPGKTPYDEFVEAGLGELFKPDRFGFDSDSPWLLEMVDAAAAPATIIEVGSFTGGSARFMADRARSQSKDLAVVCVDTWLGDHELFHTPYLSALKYQVGTPMIYYTFLATVIDDKLEDWIVPFRMDSYNASVAMGDARVMADGIYIDGSHDYDPVLLDLKQYWKLLKPGGWMVIDDYDYTGPRFAGLIRAVDTFFGRLGVQVEKGPRKARVQKPV
jgi:hypothetical protein